MPHLHRRAALLAGAALLFPAVAHADDDAQPAEDELMSAGKGGNA